MTDATAGIAADLVLASTAAAVAYAIVRTPPLRRLAGLGVRLWLGGSVSAFLLGAVRDAWAESARRV
ncbi:MAG: hypothetical protein IT176_09640 [Acidobacteria bacterium]|nr:hypothetical protein [Acidobacteriota bacterium]